MTAMLVPRGTVEITVTTENLRESYTGDAECYALGTHPVALAIKAAMPQFDDVDIMPAGALCWAGDSVTTLKFTGLGREYITACDHRMQREPFTLTAEVSS